MQVVGVERRLLAEVLGAAAARAAPTKPRLRAELHLERRGSGSRGCAIERASRDRLAEPVARQVLLVAGVAGLVDRAHQALHEVVFAVARGQAHVLGHAAAERMRALVEPAGLEVEAEQAASRRRLSARCAAFGNGPRGATHGLARLALAHLRARARAATGCRSPKTRSTSALVMPGSYGPSARRTARGRWRRRGAAPPRARARTTSRKLSRKPRPVVGRALRCARRARSARAASDVASTSDSGSAFASRPVAPHLAQVGALRRRRAAPARRARAARPGAARCAGRCSSAVHLGHRLRRAPSLPLGGIIAARSQPAIDCRCAKRCSRAQSAASSS